MASHIRRASDDDQDRIFHLARQAFPVQQSDLEHFRDRFKADRVWVTEVDGKVMATTTAHPMGHWFGGRVIPSVGIAGVAVSPEARGKGLGTELVKHVLDRSLADGIPISALYPATMPIYRALGYGHAFHRTNFRAPLAALPRGGGEGVEIREMTTDDLPLVVKEYDRAAAANAGLATRSIEWWNDRVITDRVPFRYLAFEKGQLTGWLLYSFSKTPKSWTQDLRIQDLHWTTRATSRALLTVAGLHRSTCKDMFWVGRIDDPLYEIMHDHALDIDGSFRAMLRLLDVPAALQARGYPSSVDAQINIAVVDPMRPENEGPWQLTVQKGAATVAPFAGTVETTVSIQGLASIFSGLLSATDAVRVGELESNPGASERIEAIFAGPTPWLADFF